MKKLYVLLIIFSFSTFSNAKNLNLETKDIMKLVALEGFLDVLNTKDSLYKINSITLSEVGRKSLDIDFSFDAEKECLGNLYKVSCSMIGDSGGFACNIPGIHCSGDSNKAKNKLIFKGLPSEK